MATSGEVAQIHNTPSIPFSLSFFEVCASFQLLISLGKFHWPPLRFLTQATTSLAVSKKTLPLPRFFWQFSHSPFCYSDVKNFIEVVETCWCHLYFAFKYLKHPFGHNHHLTPLQHLNPRKYNLSYMTYIFFYFHIFIRIFWVFIRFTWIYWIHYLSWRDETTY